MEKLNRSIDQAETLAIETINAGGTNEDTDNAMPKLDKIKKQHSRNFDKRIIEIAFWRELSNLKRSE